MKVSIKDLYVNMDLKTRGAELDAYDTASNHLGDLIINKSSVKCVREEHEGEVAQKSLGVN